MCGGGGGALNTHGHNTIHVKMIVDLVSFSCPFAFPRGGGGGWGGGGFEHT